MHAKSLARLSAIACLAVVSFATSADAQRGYYEGGYGYAPRYRCLSSEGVNATLARSGWYPVANVGGSPDGRVIYMRVVRGNRYFIATVEGCTGRVLQAQPGY